MKQGSVAKEGASCGPLPHFKNLEEMKEMRQEIGERERKAA